MLDSRSDKANTLSRNLQMTLYKGLRDVYQPRTSVSMKCSPGINNALALGGVSQTAWPRSPNIICSKPASTSLTGIDEAESGAFYLAPVLLRLSCGSCAHHYLPQQLALRHGLTAAPIWSDDELHSSPAPQSLCGRQTQRYRPPCQLPCFSRTCVREPANPHRVLQVSGLQQPSPVIALTLDASSQRPPNQFLQPTKVPYTLSM